VLAPAVSPAALVVTQAVCPYPARIDR